MKIAIIGGGITGLVAAYELAKGSHKVTLFEKEKTLGGLAAGFREKRWSWHLEGAYHHLFTSDSAIIGLIHELGLSKNLIERQPVTATLWKNRIYRLDSPLSLLSFPGMPILDRIRTGLFLAGLKINPYWQPLELVTAKDLAIAIGGKRAWKAIWEPLMKGKFGRYADTVAASWFWARIKKRTACLLYLSGGFHGLIEKLEKRIVAHHGSILKNIRISSIKEVLGFERILLTIPTPIAHKLVPNLSLGIGHLALTIPHLHAQTLIVETKEPILEDVYWLNVTDRSFPFLSVVAHTNFMDKKHYGGSHITYFGNYLPPGHPFLALSAQQLFKQFEPYIEKLNPRFNLKFDIINLKLFVGPYAQPVHKLRYSRIAPKLETSLPNVYLANLDNIYPWDRGTNYAVELGRRAALTMT